MDLNTQMVRVRPRDTVDMARLEELAQSGNPISVLCGVAGPSIARQIIEGGGSAEIKLSVIRLAIDTQDGVEAIFDHFVLEEPKSRAPLVHWLLRS